MSVSQYIIHLLVFLQFHNVSTTIGHHLIIFDILPDKRWFLETADEGTHNFLWSHNSLTGSDMIYLIVQRM